jgi:hypothetical protein
VPGKGSSAITHNYIAPAPLRPVSAMLPLQSLLDARARY